MELHRLRYLLAVVDEGSVTAAARASGIAQSGISSQIAKLESEVGLALFERIGRGVVLTAAGAALVPTVRAAVVGVDAVTAAAGDLRGLLLGSLRVGTVTGLAWPVLFDAVADLHAAHPGVDLTLVEGTSGELLDDVRHGRLDLAIAAWTTDPHDLESSLVADDALVAGVADDHAWASRSRIRPEELASVDVIALVGGTGAREALDAMATRAGHPVVPRWEVAAASSVEALARRGLGVGVVSETTASAWGLRRLPFADREARSRLGIAWRRSASPAAREFLTLLQG